MCHGPLKGWTVGPSYLCLAQHWVKAVEHHEPNAMPLAYADDLQATARTTRAVQKVLTVTKRFCQLTGMKLNTPKSGVWATSRRLRLQLQNNCCVDHQPIPLRWDDRCLGAYLSFTRRKCRSRIQHTEKDCDEILGRIEGLSLHLEARAHLVAAMVLPKALYGTAVSPPGEKEMRHLRAKCARAVWGHANRWRSVEAMFGLFTKGHLVDPLQKYSYDTFVSMRRVLRRRRELIPIFERIMCRRQLSRDSVPGPVASIMCAAHHANISFEDGRPTIIHHLNEHNALETVELQWLAPDCDTGGFLHALRESLRMEQWSEVAYRREDFRGAESGVNRKATLELHRMLSGLDRYRIRTILCGALNTKSRLVRLSDEVDPTCSCCETGAMETTRHLFSECPALAEGRHSEMQYEEWHNLPNCLKLLGIMPKDMAGIPARFQDEDGLKQLACFVQHNLLDLWQRRCDLTENVMQPQPRWQATRNVRPRAEIAQQVQVAEMAQEANRGTTRQTEPAQVRNVRPRIQRPDRARRTDLPSRRNVRQRLQENTFVQGANLQNGANWQAN